MGLACAAAAAGEAPAGSAAPAEAKAASHGDEGQSSAAASRSAGGGAIAPGKTVYVKEDDAEFGTGSKTAAKLSKGARIVVLEVRGAWIGSEAELDGKPAHGWIHRDKLTAVPPPKQTAKPQPAVSAAKADSSLSGHWKTTQRLLLDAPQAARAKDGQVWLSSDLKRYAFSETQGKQERLVVDGKAEKLYDKVTACNFELFFGAGQHYAYVAKSGEKEWVVVDGQESKQFHSVVKNSFHLSQDEKRFTYLANCENILDTWLVVNGDPASKMYFATELGLVQYRGHSIYLSSNKKEDSRWFAIYDGKPEKEYAYVPPKSFKLHATGAYGYAAEEEKGKRSCYVVNGVQGPWYNWAVEGSLEFSHDGKYWAYSAENLEKEQAFAVVNGNEYAVPIRNCYNRSMIPETVHVESSILDRLVLPPESACAVLSIKFTAEDEERMRELMDRNNQGILTARELAEMEGYRHVGTFLGVLQAKTRLHLKQLGTRA